MCGSALAVSFMSMTGFRTFVHSYGDVPGSQMAVIIVKPTARDVHWRRHDVSLSSDTQFWESRGTNRKTKELIVCLCGSAIHFVEVTAFPLPFQPWRRNEKENEAIFHWESPWPPSALRTQGLGHVGPVRSWSGWHWLPCLRGCEWLSPPWGDLGLCDAICPRGMSSPSHHTMTQP